METRISEQQIGLNAMLVSLCWLLGVGLVVLDRVSDHDWGQVGLILIALGHLRAMAGMLHRRDKRDLAAFNLGREAAQAGSVTPFR